jgi:hypothetical protein
MIAPAIALCSDAMNFYRKPEAKYGDRFSVIEFATWWSNNDQHQSEFAVDDQGARPLFESPVDDPSRHVPMQVLARGRGPAQAPRPDWAY